MRACGREGKKTSCREETPRQRAACCARVGGRRDCNFFLRLSVEKEMALTCATEQQSKVVPG